jgi:hypothetical protein
MHERWLRWEPQLTEASLGGACIPRYTLVPGMRPHLTPERFPHHDAGASQDSVATDPPARAEAQTQTPEEPPNEVARTLLGLYGDKDDDLFSSLVDLAEPDRRHGEAEKEHRDNPDLMDSGVANVAMAEHGFSQMAIANQPQSDSALSQGFAETLQRGKDIAEDVVFESPPPGRKIARKTTAEIEVPERSVLPNPPLGLLQGSLKHWRGPPPIQPLARGVSRRALPQCKVSWRGHSRRALWRPLLSPKVRLARQICPQALRILFKVRQ